MKYYDSKTLSDLFVEDKTEIKEWKRIINQISKLLERFHSMKIKIKKKSIESDLKYMYHEKTLERLNQLKVKKNWETIFKRELKINKRKIQLDIFLSNLEKAISNFLETYDIKNYTLLHGDLCLGNMIYDKDKIILIDPRGCFGRQIIYGDKNYDLAKLSHSFLGGYDLIINDKFKVRVKDYSINLKIEFTEKQKKISKIFMENILANYNLKHIRFIESLLFLSMIPLHSDNFNRQLAFLCKGINLYYQNKGE